MRLVLRLVERVDVLLNLARLRHGLLVSLLPREVLVEVGLAQDRLQLFQLRKEHHVFFVNAFTLQLPIEKIERASLF